MPKVYALLVVIIILCLETQPLYGLNASHVQLVARDLLKLKTLIQEMADPYVKITITEESPKCVQMQCKFICFNGQSAEIVSDIMIVHATSKYNCDRFEEVRLYNYDFPNNRIPRGFLGEYGSQIVALYIASSNITDIEGGTFASGIFKELYFENLKLKELRKDFFTGISSDFTALTVIQKDEPLTSICSDFLDYVKYQIKLLSLQVGISCVRNMTASNNLLNNLAYVDFSHNNFADKFDKSVFNMLSLVEHMDLSHSRLSYLPEYIFSDFVATLEYLDVSFNQLKTISRTIFGWRDIPRELRIIAEINPWECSCSFRGDMKEIFAYQSTQLFCKSPEEFYNWSVFDDRLCAGYANATISTTTAKSTTMGVTKSTGKYDTTTHAIESDDNEALEPNTIEPNGPPIVTTIQTITTIKFDDDYNGAGGGGGSGGSGNIIPPPDYNSIVQLECHAVPPQLEKSLQLIRWPTLEFYVVTEATLRVDVIIQSSDLGESYGLIWFSRVTKQYYKMEVNYNEYGLGCYGSISYFTTVENLLPDVAYTFCLVLKDQLTISPFSCKSMHVSGNLNVEYSAWLTRDMRATGISLVIFGIVMFSFVGILLVFLILKRKPTLLKGSKRIAKTKGSSKEIVVFPKDKTPEDFKLKEEMLAKRNSRSTISCTNRRGSSDSIDSNQSYMNANLYEVIPAYLKLNEETPNLNALTTHNSNDQPDSYLPPLVTHTSTENLVSYAEIPARAKRVSNDPLPEVPADRTQISWPLSQYPDRLEDCSAEYIMTLDSQV